MCPYGGATTASALALRAAAGHLACLSGVDQLEAMRNLIQIIPAQLLFRLSFTGGTVCLYGDLVVATGVAQSMLRRAPKPTAVSAVWRSMCCTRSACTGDSAVAGVVTSSFFVASFVGHRPIFWGNYFSSSVLYLTTTVCKQRAANCEGPNAEKHRLQFTLESGCVVKRPRRAPVKAHDHYPEVGTSIRKRLVISQDHYVRRFMSTPMGEHPQGY